MSKEYEKVRLKLKKEYDEKFKELDRLKKIELDYNRLKLENDNLEQENEQLKDWVNRLLEYCNLSKEELELLKEKSRLTKTFCDFIGLANNFTQRF